MSMKEVLFLRKNKDKWNDFEHLIKSHKRVDPDVLAGLYTQLIEDLSYARTFYPKSKTVTYLNQLTTKIHGEIYKNKKEDTGRFIRFWKTELPMLFYDVRKYFLVSFLIFAFSGLVGMISAANDVDFIRVILGDRYVDMTLENIEKGDPMAVYKQSNEIDMFLQITFNNIRVSFMAFVLGVFFSIGTGYILFLNGVMLGSFQYFFYDKGLFLESFKTVWIHGTLEISAIVIAGAAGIIIGNSFLFPGTYKRQDSFKIGAKKGIKIVVGLIPVFILAGFLESFVTRHDSMPLVLSFGIILLSALSVLFYFVIYPYMLNNTNKQNGRKSIN